MHTKDNLQQTLQRLDGRSYAAYKDLHNTYDFGSFTLHIDHIQSDPFAAPSRLRVVIPQQIANYPPHTYQCKSRTIALCTYLADCFGQYAHKTSRRSGSGKSGLIEMDVPGQQLIERTCIHIDRARVEARFSVGLPATGRRARGRQAGQMLCIEIPTIVESALYYAANDADKIERYIQTSEDADSLRAQLAARDLIAFVADGSILPRISGISDQPLNTVAVSFKSPDSLRVEFDLPHAGSISGMGVRQGVTVIVGGGFHGKSTLLHALERGVYNHRPDDGREFVVCNASSTKIRAEDGRSIAGVDISPFINNLPFARDTRAFASANASGSTSQAANTIEALEAGAQVLLIDEDTAATNFMIRDARMRELVQSEPITPFFDRVRTLYEQHGVSTVLVAGGSGDYFDVADTVIAMENYQPRDVTREARAIAAAHPAPRQKPREEPFCTARRIPLRQSLDPQRGRREQSVQARGLEKVLFGEEQIDLSCVEQLVDPGQTRALAAALLYAREHYIDDNRSLREILICVERDLDAAGLDVLDASRPGNLVRFRSIELAAALNRLRSLRLR
jgi:predicted ABC-class ATPase